jgi:hypothetical protein
MIEEVKPLIKYQLIDTGAILDVIQDGPIMETIRVPIVEPIPSVYLPTYTKSIGRPLPPTIIPATKKPSSELKRKVSLNPLSD